MKRILLLILLFCSLQSFAASKYWVGGGTNSNWNSSPVTNWANSSGGAGNQTAPGSGDDVFFDGVGATANSASTVSSGITVLSLTFSSGYTQTVTLNATLTIAGNFTDNTAHSWAGSSNMTISATSTITSGGKTFPNSVSFSSAATRTLVGNWIIGGSLSTSASPAVVINATTNETLTFASFTATGSFSGTAKFIMSGGTWSGSGVIQNNLDIQGNVTVSGSVFYNTGTLTYVSGTVTTTSSTLTIAASTTLNTAGITWNNITISVSSTLTLNSLLSASLLTISSSVVPTFAGTGGFTVGTLTCSNITSNTITLNDAATYTVTTALNAFNSRTGAILLFTSDHASNLVPFTLNQGATCNVLANFTRINASGGRTIRSFNGTITSCTNVVAFNDIGTSKH